MDYDIIPITSVELEALTVVQTKLLRTAQQKKDELERKAAKELQAFSAIAQTNGMKNSSLISSMEAYLQADVDDQVAVLADNLIYNMSLNEPTTGGELGGEGGDESAGYIVDYSLSYNDRYLLVRDYYLSIPDPDERITLYLNDEVAKKYLDAYYVTLYNVLIMYAK